MSDKLTLVNYTSTPMSGGAQCLDQTCMGEEGGKGNMLQYTCYSTQ